MKKKILFAIGFVAVFAMSSMLFAYNIPYQNSRAHAFYVFGPEGDPLMGAGDSTMEIFVDVPVDEQNKVTIEVYDPDTGGFFDWIVPGNEWNTACKYQVYGKELLDSAEFGASPEWDQKWYMFGPYDKTQGEKVGDIYRFRIVVTGIKGDDENLFRVKVSPKSAESWAGKVMVRLAPREGDQMFFYPYVPAGTGSVIVENYDLDPTGGTSTLSVTTITEKFSIKDSDSGEWRETVVPISTDTGGRMVYIITKGTQRYANAGFSMRTDKGDAIPIYFRRGAPPVASAPAPARPRPEAKPDLKCNKFTFDATSSYDPARQKLYFHWDFGDGNTSTEPVVTHIYEKGGEYTVRLTATNESGLPCDTAGTTQKILVNTPPAAAFSAPELVCVEDKVNFDASKTTDDTSETLTYMWNLGDGTRAEGQKVQHTYAKGGTYNVTLNVDDNAGTACSTDTIQRTIKVNTSPVADAGRDIDMCLKSIDEEYAVDLDGTRSRDPDGDDLSYVWNMGDGTTLQGAKVRHVYKTGGAYKATLTVDDGKGLPCSKASDALNVSLNKSPVAVISGEKKLCLGQSAAFDGSSSRVEQGQKLTYKWAMGDGSEVSGEKITHKYDKGGKYAVVLTVDDGKGTTCSSATDVAMIHVNSRPEASLGKVSDTCVGKRVSFDASESSDPDGDSLAYIWNFGDGTVETSGSRMTHTYQKGGKYTVSVTVDDGKGTPCSTSSDSVSLKVNTPPSARMTIGEECCVDMEQKFDGSGSIDPDGDALTYSWDFGDGSSGEGVRVSHSYAKPGTYKVTLRVDDGSGTECSADFTVGEMKVSGNPVAVIKVR